MNITDTDRLDFLTKATQGYGGWILRQSVLGRGMRLHESSMEPNFKTPREAIDDAIQNGMRKYDPFGGDNA